jgi:hypothetical protein
MANRMNRYKALAEKTVRNDSAILFPRHVFVRSANSNGDEWNRKGDR